MLDLPNYYHINYKILVVYSQNQNTLSCIIDAIGVVYGKSAIEKVMSLPEADLSNYTISKIEVGPEVHIKNFLSEKPVCIDKKPSLKTDLMSTQNLDYALQMVSYDDTIHDYFDKDAELNFSKQVDFAEDAISLPRYDDMHLVQISIFKIRLNNPFFQLD